jgi:ribose 1,5-bisphosphokinase
VLPETATAIVPVAPPRHGVFVAVVGPSGAGKDSLINAARDRLAGDARFVFARRLITRVADGSEPHASIEPDQFEEMETAGAFALSWHANGLGYALPITLLEELASGHVIIANLSREIVPTIKTKFPSTLIVHITAHLETLRHRLAARGREDDAARELRIARSMLLEQSIRADVQIGNDGPLEDGVMRFLSVLRSVAP